MLKVNSVADIREILQSYNREKEQFSLLMKSENSIMTTHNVCENTSQDIRNDSYCWICHKEGNVLCCEVCPRVFHLRCLKEEEEPPGDWVCPECQAIMKAEDIDSRSPAMASLDMDGLCRLLKFALHKMKQLAPDAFLRPVSIEQFPSYSQYVFHPMDLSSLEKNIQNKMYGCTQSFMADVKWILHNCIIFNGYQHQLTNNAKSLVKLCKYEMEEIEICPDCYLHSCMHREYWFCEPCRKPHIVVWAKLKGFPFWPAKVMRVVNDSIDVRFFGAHDRAWVLVSQCYLLSKEMPTQQKCKKKGSFETSLEEITIYAYRIKEIFGTFEYAPLRTPFDPNNPPLYSTLMQADILEKTYSPFSSCVSSPMSMVSFPALSPITQPSTSSDYGTKVLYQDSPKKLKSKEGRYGKVQSSKASKNLTSTIKSLSESPVEEKHKISNYNTYTSRVDSTEQIKHNITPVKRPPPVGIFEVSDESNIKMPALLEINIPTLNLKKVNKTHEKIVEKLESKIQQIKEISKENSDDEIPEKITSKEIWQSSRNKEQCIYSTDENTNSFGSTEYDKTETGTNQKVQRSVLNLLSDSDSDDKPLSKLCQVSSVIPSVSKDDNFLQKLSHTIESCKAKLGIKEIKDDIETVDSDEDYILPMNDNDSASDDDGNNRNNKNTSTNNITSKSSSEVHSPQIVNFSSANFNKISLDNSDSCKIVKEKEQNQHEISDDDFDSDDSQPLAVIIQKAKMAKKVEEEVKETKKNDEHTMDDLNSEKNFIPQPEPEEKTDEKNSEETAADDLSPPRLFTVEEEDQIDVENAESEKEQKDNYLDEDSSTSKIDDNSMSLNESCDNQPVVVPDMAEIENLKSTVKMLQLELERLRYYHQHEILEMKHNSDLVLLEMRASVEADKQKMIAELQQQYEKDKQKCIEETKKKQWCANCGNEAAFYCCWNTNYCNHTCQQNHWPKHMVSCGQSKMDEQQNSLKKNQTVKEEAVQSFTVALTPTKVVSPPQQPSSILKHSASQQSKPLIIQPQFPQVQYIPSNAVQVIPQTTSLLGTSGQPVQIQYFTNLASVPKPSSPFVAVESSPFPIPSQTTSLSVPAVSNQGNEGT